MGGQAGQRSAKLLTGLVSLSPLPVTPTFKTEVAVTVEADLSIVATGGEGTLDLVLTTGTFLVKVAVEVALKAWPVWH